MPAKKRQSEAKQFAAAAARIAEEDNAEDIVVLNLSGISPVTDFFVIATGTSNRQLRSIAEDIAKHGKETGEKVWHIAGADQGRWIILDFVDVVVHLFDAEYRGFYDLELIWGEAPKVRWKQAK